jgi:hypothetical protein
MTTRQQPTIAWADPPPVQKLPRIEIASPRPGSPIHLICLSHALVFVWTHYLHQRTQPCRGSEELCEGCQLDKPKRLKAYAAGETRPQAKQVLIEITYDGYRNCKELHAVNADLYGKKITLKRAGQARNSRVIVTVEAGEGPSFNHPAFDVKEALCRIWFGEKTGQERKRKERFEQLVNQLTQEIAPLPQD